jgi:hypothetical protein
MLLRVQVGANASQNPWIINTQSIWDIAVLIPNDTLSMLIIILDSHYVFRNTQSIPDIAISTPPKYIHVIHSSESIFRNAQLIPEIAILIQADIFAKPLYSYLEITNQYQILPPLYNLILWRYYKSTWITFYLEII